MSKPVKIEDLPALANAVKMFVAERDWDQFHTPKNLTMALSVEVSELLEHFQWLTAEESDQLPEAVRSEVADEIGDVLIYLIRLSDRLAIDLVQAAAQKLKKNHGKYPVALSRGKSAKYTAYKGEES